MADGHFLDCGNPELFTELHDELIPFVDLKHKRADCLRLLEPLHQQMISDYGIMLDDGPSKFKVIHEGNKYIVILSEGRNRQIRRTFAALGYHVTKLHRTTFGKYELSGLKPGKCAIIKP